MVGSISGSGWTKTGGEMLERVNEKLGSLLAVYDIQSVIIFMSCTGINLQHLLEEVPVQAPADNMLVKEHLVEGERFVGGSDGEWH